MLPLLSSFFTSLAALFVVVEPLGVVPTFAALTADRTRADARLIARRASIVGALVLFAFAIGGRAALSALGVRIDAFRVAGGLLLLLTALDMLRGKSAQCRCTPAELQDAAHRHDVAVVPVAVPLLSGPGAMATVMMLSSKAAGPVGLTMVLVAISLTFAISYLVLRSAALLNRALGRSTMSVFQRVMGLVLGAMSIQSIVEGAVRLFGSLTL